MAPDLYQSLIGGEVSDTVPVTLGSVSDWRELYAVPLPDLAKGDVLLAIADGELGNDLGINVEVCAEIRLEADGSVYPLTRLNGFNVDWAMHYWAHTKAALYKVPVDLIAPRAVVRARARSAGAQPGNVLSVKRGYGRFSVARFART